MEEGSCGNSGERKPLAASVACVSLLLFVTEDDNGRGLGAECSIPPVLL